MLFGDTVQQYATNLIGFFTRKGKRTLAESLFHNYIGTKMTSKKKNPYSLLSRCKIKTSTYIGLLAKRRGKRVKYRVRFLNKEAGARRGLLLVGRSTYLHTQKSSRQFNWLLNQELETWGFGKHPLRARYKEMHIIARKHGPWSWFKRKKKQHVKKTKNKTGKKIENKTSNKTMGNKTVGTKILDKKPMGASKIPKKAILNTKN